MASEDSKQLLQGDNGAQLQRPSVSRLELQLYIKDSKNLNKTICEDTKDAGGYIYTLLGD